ncbi:MAG TPA: hypothetical protein PKA13_18920 [Geminicoccaceae bacterium]|nr:hypothetical protein [Geminicoccaceae bacterium]
MRIAFHDTHVYPGCRATLDGEPDGEPGEAEFSDGVIVAAAATPLGPDELLVKLAAHRTARGTAIVAKDWILRRIGGEAWKVVRRAMRRG